jgi:hypothetical protein
MTLVTDKVWPINIGIITMYCERQCVYINQIMYDGENNYNVGLTNSRNYDRNHAKTSATDNRSLLRECNYFGAQSLLIFNYSVRSKMTMEQCYALANTDRYRAVGVSNSGRQKTWGIHPLGAGGGEICGKTRKKIWHSRQLIFIVYVCAYHEKLLSSMFSVELWDKVRLYLRLNSRDVLGSVDISPKFLTSALDGKEWSVSRPGHFIPGERAPCAHWMGGRTGPRAGLDAVELRDKFLASAGNRSPTIQPVAHRYTNWAIPAPRKHFPVAIIIYRVWYGAEALYFSWWLDRLACWTERME